MTCHISLMASVSPCAHPSLLAIRCSYNMYSMRRISGIGETIKLYCHVKHAGPVNFIVRSGNNNAAPHI